MYCTLDDILLRYPFKDIKELTQDDNVSPNIDAARTDVAISDACEFIDSKISKRYEIPLSPVPPRIKRVAVDLAVYYIYKLRYDSKVPEQIDITYKEAVSFLDSIRNCEEDLTGIELKGGNEFIVMSGFAEIGTSAFDVEELAKL